MDYDEDPDYLDLDDILSQAQTVDCILLIKIPGLESILQTSVNDSKQGSKILLPFWMAKTLYTYSMIDIIIPKCYNDKFREIVFADPNIVDLHKFGPYYYHFGKLLMSLRREKGNNIATFNEEGQRNKYRREEGESLVDRRFISESLIDTFHRRRHKLLEISISKASLGELQDAKNFESRLDNMEKRLFKIGRQQVEMTNRWRSRRIEMIGNNLIAARLSKRRRMIS